MVTDNGKVNDTRSLVISDFRNLGISALRKSSDERTALKINRCLKKDEIGGLVIILGGNNCGKSNVLDAVAKCNRQEFDDEKDITDFIRAPKRPRLEMDIAGGKYGEIKAPKMATGAGRYKIIGTVPDVILYILRQKESFELFNEWTGEGSDRYDDIESYMNGNEEQIRYMSNGMESSDGKVFAYIIRNREGILGESLDEIANSLEDGNIAKFARDRMEVIVKGTPVDDVVVADYEYISNNRLLGKVPVYVRKDRLDEYRSSQKGFVDFAKKAMSLFVRGERGPVEDVMIKDLSGGVKDTEVIPDAFSDVYGYNISGNVYKYSQRKILNSDLTTEAYNPNEFITRVFSLLGYENGSIINKYYEVPSIREKLEDDLNKELAEVSRELNRLLNAGDREYGLRIRLEKDEIRFSISCGDNKAINLDHQSEGFRWIFGFFINFLMSKKFVAGDMVIIDEFGGLLNFGTVAELANILRDFSRKHGLTFIIATQNPMAVDIAHLDEIRMIAPRADGGSDILNDFTEFGRGECMDVLRPIVASMTVGRNYLRSKENATVFVENYRDYFYLTGFNSKFGYDIDFIPVNGITEFTSPETFAKVLRSIEQRPILLVDDATHDDVTIEELRKNKVEIYTVSEIFGDEKGSVIDLFSAEDGNRLSVADATFDVAATLSHSIPYDESISEETNGNFRRILDYISLE